jgi:hypothetical protein
LLYILAQYILYIKYVKTYQRKPVSVSCLATGEPGISHGTTNDEVSTGVDMEDRVLITAIYT